MLRGGGRVWEGWGGRRWVGVFGGFALGRGAGFEFAFVIAVVDPFCVDSQLYSCSEHDPPSTCFNNNYQSHFIQTLLQYRHVYYHSLHSTGPDHPHSPVINPMAASLLIDHTSHLPFSSLPLLSFSASSLFLFSASSRFFFSFEHTFL